MAPSFRSVGTHSPRPAHASVAEAAMAASLASLALWGSLLSCGRAQRAPPIGFLRPAMQPLEERRLPTAAQDAILPHKVLRNHFKAYLLGSHVVRHIFGDHL